MRFDKFNLLLAACMFALVFLTGCEPTHRDISETFKLPPELADCKIHTLKSKHLEVIRVMTCPESTCRTLSYMEGKTRQYEAYCQ